MRALLYPLFNNPLILQCIIGVLLFLLILCVWSARSENGRLIKLNTLYLSAIFYLRKGKTDKFVEIKDKIIKNKGMLYGEEKSKM